MLQKVLPGNTPQYLCQMKSDLHKTFRVLQDWSPELINNVRACACARMHIGFLVGRKAVKVAQGECSHGVVAVHERKVGANGGYRQVLTYLSYD